jgi:hypothetical protein
MPGLMLRPTWTKLRSSACVGPCITELHLTLAIACFLAFGAAFGLATHAKRHLFSEGPTHSAADAEPDLLNGRVLWMLICTFLWPVMALTGLNSMRLIAQRARAARALGAKRD